MSEVRRLPDSLAEVFEPLSKEIHLLHGRWTIYRQLFAESQKRFDLLNECAPGFFGVLYGVLHDEILLSLCKLGDPAKDRLGNENLSLQQIQGRLKGDSSLAARTGLLIPRYDAKCKPFRDWRNKRISHLDLLVALAKHVDRLPDISREMIEDALAVVREFMNTIDAHYTDTTRGYEHFFQVGDGEALITALKYGLRYEELLQGRVLKHGDWRRSKWDNA